MDELETESQEMSLRDAARLASGMLWADRYFLPVLYGLMVLPGLIAGLLLPPHSEANVIVHFGERLLAISALWILGLRWVKLLSAKPPVRGPRSAIYFFGFSILLWAALVVPFFAQFLGGPRELRLLMFAAVIPAVIINLRYFFIFFPPLLGIDNSKGIAALALGYTNSDRWIGLRCVIAPAGVFLLATAIVQGFSPDGRSIAVALLTDFVSGIFWLLSAYLALAVGFMQLPESLWRAQGLDPYRKSRLTTIAVRGPAWIATGLLPKKGLIMFVLAALVWAGNLMRLADLPPGPNLKVTSLKIDQGHVLVTIEAEDPEYKFRGFYPVFFSLAGEKRTTLAEWPIRTLLDNDGSEAQFGLPSDRTSASLTLDFETPRQEKDLVTLTDVWLWYRNTKIAKLDLGSAERVSTPTPPEPKEAKQPATTSSI